MRLIREDNAIDNGLVAEIFEIAEYISLYQDIKYPRYWDC